MAKKTQQHRFQTRLPPSPSTTLEEEEESFVDDEEEEQQQGERDIPSSFRSYDETNYVNGVDEEEEEENEDDEYDDDGRGTAPANSASYSIPNEPQSVNSSTTTTPPPSYVNVAPLPVFRGLPGECPVAHLSRFSHVCRANNATTVDMIARIFPVTLEDEAALWYELTVEPSDPSPLSISWAETKSLFLETYRRPEQSRSELMAIKQQEKETVNSYHLRMQWILKKWPEHGIPDEILKGIFVDGLRREECQDWVVLQRPNSFAEAFRLALSWERAESTRLSRKKKEESGGGGGSLRCGFCDGGHEESGCEVRRKMKELWGMRSRSSDVGMVRKDEEGGGGDGVVVVGGGGGGGLKRSQCMCWKHQCWKKFDRSVSVPVVRAPPPAGAE